MHIYNWDEWSQKTIPVPMVVGHEYVGEVVGIGQEVRGFKIGDRVSGEGISPAATAVTAARAAPSVPQHHRRGRQPPGLLC
ncbi:L-threonine 3-dehydrogenase [Serratia liquefaciens]|nr:L-threonine 3-dehydrogenase [Serratia liquefaciens]